MTAPAFIAFLLVAFYFIFALQEKRWWWLIGGTAAFRLVYGLVLTSFIFDPILFGHSIAIFLGLPVLLYFYQKAFPKNPLEERAVFIVVVYAIFEYLSVRFMLIPGFIVHSSNLFSHTDLIGLGRYFGWWGPGVFTLALAMLTAVLLSKELQKKRKRIVGIILITVIFCGSCLAELGLYQNARAAAEHRMNVALVSVRPSFDGDTAMIYERLSSIVRELGSTRYDLIVFPEGMFDLEVTDLEQDANVAWFRELAREYGAPVLMNVNLHEAGGRYNTNVLLGGGGATAGLYRKEDLIFIGERSPAWLGPSKFVAGDNNSLFTIEGKKEFATPICFEAHLPQRIAEWQKRGVAFLVNSSSNKWLTRRVEDYISLTFGLRRLYAASYAMPIMINGRNDDAGIVYPDGSFERVELQPNQEYTIYKGQLRY